MSLLRIFKDFTLLISVLVMIVAGAVAFIPESVYLGAFFLLIMMIAFAVCALRFIQLIWRMKKCPICKQDLIPNDKLSNWIVCPNDHYLYNNDDEDTFFNTKKYNVIIRTRLNHTIIRNLQTKKIILEVPRVMDVDWGRLDKLDEHIATLLVFS